MANNYFVCNRNGIRSLYKTASRCNKMNKLSTLHNVVPMVQMTMVDENGNIYREWVEKTNAVVTPLVFGTIKGYVVPITDAEIWEFIDKNLSAAERAKDFKVLRAEFNRPNDSDVECWHRSGATIATCELWTPFDKIPTDLVFD